MGKRKYNNGKKRKKRINDNYLYLMIESDEYELPLAVGNTISELAGIVGTSPNSISSAISQSEKGKIKKSIYIKVKIKGDLEDDK